MKCASIIYLDPALISMAYEEFKGVSPITKIVRTEQLTGGIGAGPFRLTGGSHEAREYSVSTAQMFYEIEGKLREYPRINAEQAFGSRDLFWTQGMLAIGMQTRKRNDEVLSEVSYFTLSSEDGGGSKQLDLVTNDSYFTSGYDRMAGLKETLGAHIWEPAEALIRPLYSNPNQKIDLFAPLVLLRGR